MVNRGSHFQFWQAGKNEDSCTLIFWTIPAYSRIVTSGVDSLNFNVLKIVYKDDFDAYTEVLFEGAPVSLRAEPYSLQLECFQLLKKLWKRYLPAA